MERELETIRLYYDDPYMKEFEAVVLNCIPDGKRYRIKLNCTAFYPEGGGQPCDLGRLGSEPVLDVQEENGIIYHTVAHSLMVTAPVVGRIDWARRFDHMQQHSGEHIVSGMLCEAYHCDNVGFHMGADVVTIDYNAEIPWEGVLEIERRANRYIQENHVPRIWWPSQENLEAQKVGGTIVKRPGFSEHNCGLAMDVGGSGDYTLEQTFANTPAYTWLMEHCADYGFILRFPEGKEDITGVIYEPWHYRYVGVEAARYIMDNDLCLEEYLAQVKK